MAKHFCLKEWVNGYELSVSIDDNGCNKFRGEIALFSYPAMVIDDISRSLIKEWGCRSVEYMAELILEARDYAQKLPEGKYGIFDTYVSE